MRTIVSRHRKDGSLGYTAQIRIHRQGRCIHSESETFDRRQLATEWVDYIAHVEARRREGAGPATANNDMIWLRGVFRDGWRP